MRWQFWRPQPPPAEPADEPLLTPPPLPEADLIRRGEAATRLLTDPVLQGAFDEIRHDSYRMWLDTKPSETVRREELYRIIQALELVRGKLRAYRGAQLMREAERAAQRDEDRRELHVVGGE